MKYIRITMPDNSQWDISTDIIAERRASYLAYNDTREVTGSEFHNIYNIEYDKGLLSIDKLIGWLENNIKWEDIEADAERVIKSVTFDFDDGLIHGKKEIIEK